MNDREALAKMTQVMTEYPFQRLAEELVHAGMTEVRFRRLVCELPFTIPLPNIIRMENEVRNAIRKQR